MLRAIQSNNFQSFKLAVKDTPSVNEQYNIAYEILMRTSRPFEFIQYWQSHTCADLRQVCEFVSEDHGLLLNRLIKANAPLDSVVLAVTDLYCDPFNDNHGDVAPIFAMYDAGYALEVLKTFYDRPRVAFHLMYTKIIQTGQTLMHYAASRGDLPFVLFLVREYGIDKHLEYYNAEKQRFDAVVDCFYQSKTVSDIIPLLFEKSGLGYNPNTTYVTQQHMTYFTRACEIPDLDMTWFFQNMHCIHLNQSKWPACLVAAKAKRFELAALLATRYNDNLFIPDDNNVCALYYMLVDFHPVYYTVIDSLQDEGVVDYNHQWTAIDVIALKCPLDVLKYVVRKGWRTPSNLLTTCLTNLTPNDETSLETTLDKAMYLISHLKYDALSDNQSATLLTAADLMLALFLHFVHRAAPVYLPLPPIDQDDNRDQMTMRNYYIEHDTLPNPHHLNKVAVANTNRISLALEYAYDVLPPDYAFRPYTARRRVSNQSYAKYVEQCRRIKRALLQMIVTSMEQTQYKLSDDIKLLFHPDSKLYHIFNKPDVQTLSALSKRNLP